MEDQNKRISEIRQKTGRLVKQYNQLKEDNNGLREAYNKLSEDLAEAHKKIEEIQNKDINLHLSRALENGEAGEAAGLKQRLDEYIREIEAVIAFLKD